MRLRLNAADALTQGLLGLMAAQFNLRPGLRRYLTTRDGPLAFCVGIATTDGEVAQHIRFRAGRAQAGRGLPNDADVVLRFTDREALRQLLDSTPNEMLSHILGNRLLLDGNMAYLQLFNFLCALLLNGRHTARLQQQRQRDRARVAAQLGQGEPGARAEFQARQGQRLRAPERDPGVEFLTDPYLADVHLDQFPRLQRFLADHLDTPPEVCIERPALLTAWYRDHGFETDRDGRPWSPVLRQAQAFRNLMAHKAPLIRPDDRLAGTTTAKPICGVILYPDAHGTMIWGELLSLAERPLNPYRLRAADIDTLHHDILPFWVRRNFREWVRDRHGNPDCLRLDERWVAYFVWKSVGISHTIPDFPRLLAQGTEGMIAELTRRLGDPDLLPEQRDSLEAMRLTLDGVNAYADNLAREAARQADAATTDTDRARLRQLALLCAQVPRRPARSLHEALQAIWTLWIALHMENTNTGLSLGRLDQWLQPYLRADLAALPADDPNARPRYLHDAIELLGCFFLRCTDHLPLVPDLGNYLFGGSSSDQAITLGGVTPAGADGVNDMSYLLLKVTELLSIRDPNVNARYHPEINSPTWLRRLCEVNYLTAATPSMHNDLAVFASLRQHGYPEAAIRDWAATGCVEPTLCGQHMGHTGSILFNLVAALELTLHNGTHSQIPDIAAPRTGDPGANVFADFDAFYAALVRQLGFLIGHATTLNTLLAEAHAALRPSPLLSSLTQGCLDTGRDVTAGGARYNSSGTANIGLADVVDSLLVIEQLVYTEQRISFPRLIRALKNNYQGDPELLALIRHQVPLFGAGDDRAVAMANRVTASLHALWRQRPEPRGGHYTVGYWSMSQHVAYGKLSAALPSGRRAHQPFTPGLTPQAHASKSFLDNIRDIARLTPEHLDNNIACNVKLTPSAHDSHAKTIDTMRAYVDAYCRLGGMQMQFNVVTAEVLKDAMRHPEQYKNLLVRISGYNAYFVTLNRDMQLELIERAQYGL